MACSSAVLQERTAFDRSSLADAAADESSALSQDAAPAPVLETSSGMIVIDAGHQESGDSTQEPIGPGAAETKARVTGGTSGVSTGNPEYEVNLEVALKLRDALVARGFTVVMVRETNDVNLSNAERATIANEAQADLFIRLHCDGIDDPSVNGFMTLIPGDNEWTSPIVEESAAAADSMHALIISQIGATDRGIIERTDLSGFNWCQVPTVLFEMGVMSNAVEDQKLGSEEYQQTVASAIADATVLYIGQKN